KMRAGRRPVVSARLLSSMLSTGETAVLTLQSVFPVPTPDTAADFIHVDYPEPHAARTKQILAAHPEVRRLFGPTPSTFAWILALVALQVGVTFAVARAPWWVILIVAYS